MRKTKIIKFSLIFIFAFLFLNIYLFNYFKLQKSFIPFEKCFISPNNSNLSVIHLIITRFMIEYWPFRNFPNIIYTTDYILNGIRVMKKYLIPSLENQSCKKFIFIIRLGNKANISYIKSLFDSNVNSSLKYKIIFDKDMKSYIRNISKGKDILITTRIDYDDRIYYDAVNDVRKAININKPMILYGYNSGVHYYELDNTYYEFTITHGNNGVMSLFLSLIVSLNKVNDSYNIYDLGTHIRVRKKLLDSYRKYGIKELNYEPAIFDSGDVKFVWVRQNYSGLFNFSSRIKTKLKPYKFNLSKFYGKY